MAHGSLLEEGLRLTDNHHQHCTLVIHNNNHLLMGARTDSTTTNTATAWWNFERNIEMNYVKLTYFWGDCSFVLRQRVCVWEREREFNTNVESKSLWEKYTFNQRPNALEHEQVMSGRERTMPYVVVLLMLRKHWLSKICFYLARKVKNDTFTIKSWRR